MIKFEIFTKPLSVNQCYGTSQTGRIYMTAVGKKYKQGIIISLKQLQLSPLQGDIRVSIELKLGRRRKMDIDNCLKPLLDSLEGYIYENDSQIVDLRITKQFDFAEDRICISADNIDV